MNICFDKYKDKYKKDKETNALFLQVAEVYPEHYWEF